METKTLKMKKENSKMKIEKVIKDMEMELTETEIKETLFFEIFVNLTVGEMGKALEQLYSTHYPYISINIKREDIHEESHLFGYSKVMWLNAMENCLNEFWNEWDIYAHWKRVDRDTYAIELLHKDLIRPEAYEYFKIA